MSRDDGFAVMDVSVDIVNDPKIRKLYRVAPDHAGSAVVAYVATLGESWKAGQRVSVEDAWPAFLPFDAAAVEALKHVRLLESKGFVMFKAWKSWFTPAQTRREAIRERWRRANEKRAQSSTNDHADTASHNGGDSDATASSPRGNRAATAANHSVPYRSDPSRTDSVPSETRDSPPPPAERGRRANGTNPRANGTSPRKRAANPRANGTSTRQKRADQKRGPTELHRVLNDQRAGLVDREPMTDGPSWMQPKPEPADVP